MVELQRAKAITGGVELSANGELRLQAYGARCGARVDRRRGWNGEPPEETGARGERSVRAESAKHW